MSKQVRCSALRRACPPKRRVRAKRASRVGGSNSVVESQPSKLLVAGSIPVSRSSSTRPVGLAHGRPASCSRRHGERSRRKVVCGIVAGQVRRRSRRSGLPRRSGEVVKAEADLSAVARRAKADVAQLAEHVLGKDEVTGSIPVIGSRLRFTGVADERSLGRPASEGCRAVAPQERRRTRTSVETQSRTG